MRALKIFALANAMVAAVAILPSVASADAFDRLPEGAPLYAGVRPLALANALKRLGIDKMPEVEKLKGSLGVDPLDPALLAPTGIDPAAAIAASLFQPAPNGRFHHRAVVTLRDQLTFQTFLGAIAASGQAPITMVDANSALGKAGVRFTGNMPDGTVVIARIDGDTLILDALGDSGAQSTPKKKKAAPTAAEVVKLYPLAVKAQFTASAGARKLFAPEAAAVLYADGRHLAPFLEVADDPPTDAAGKKKFAACKKTWQSAVGAFDDAGIALSVDPAGVELQLAWGTQGGVPLGGLRFQPIDDGGLDVEALSVAAPLSLAVYAASLSPFSAVKRGPIQQSFDALSSSVQKCGAPAWGHVLVRSWPQGIGAALAAGTSGKSQDPMMAGLVGTIGKLRNLTFVLRNSDSQSVRGVLSSTFDPQARGMLELLLASAPGGGVEKPIGKRTPKVYTLNFGDLNGIIAALETLSAGTAAMTIADSEESLTWALKPPLSARNSAPLPLLSAHLDGVMLSKMPMMGLLGSEAAQRFVEELKRLKRIDARVTADGDLFRVSVRAAVKQ